MINEKLKPLASANRLTRILDMTSQAFNSNRFPVDVDKVIFEAGNIFNFDEPVTNIAPASVDNFEGMLFKNGNNKNWTILYNPNLKSKGRVNFTKAHELGHYILHKESQNEFICSKDAMMSNSATGTNIESEANIFAASLLMPLNDFRTQIDGIITLDLLSRCAERYGTSLTATIIRWLEFTDENAVLINSCDGFMNWCRVSKRALRSGAFFKTKGNIIEIPESSLCADSSIETEKLGRDVKGTIWFENANSKLTLKEFKYYSKSYDSTLTLLLLPRPESVWSPNNFEY